MWCQIKVSTGSFTTAQNTEAEVLYGAVPCG